MSDIKDFVIENSVLKKYTGDGGDVVIPEGVTSIEIGAFCRCGNLTNVTISKGVTDIFGEAFRGCFKLQSVQLPDSVENIGIRAFYGCGSLTDITIPNGISCIKEGVFSGCSRLAEITLPANLTNIGKEAFSKCVALKDIEIPNQVVAIEANAFAECKKELRDKVADWAKKHGMVGRESVGYYDLAVTYELPNTLLSVPLALSDRALAYIYLFQRDKKWRGWLQAKYKASKPSEVFNHMLEILQQQDKIPKGMAMFAAEFVLKYASGVDNSAIARMLSILESKKCSAVKSLRETLNFKTDQDNPIESFVRERTAKQKPDQRIELAIKTGIHYANSKETCSREALIYLIWRYAKQMKFDRHGLPDLKPGNMIMPDPDADNVANALDRTELSMLLTRLVKGSYGLYLLPWARYATDDRIHELTDGHISMSRGKPKCDNKGSNLYEALLLSETRTAMQMFDRFGDLDRYAQRHNMTAMECRDSMMLPAFDFDADGVKRYDIGGNTIEVSIAPDLSFRLFDVNKQKEIHSFPKKSDDPAKAEACAKDFAAFKKEVLAFAKERTELLHKMHMSGEYVRPDLWRKVYVEHPVISKLAQLVVWQDEAGKTFMIVDSTTVDAQNNACAPQGKIRVAHVLDMEPSDVAAWQQWLTKHGCVQLFEQVWEPVIQWNKNDIAARYSGATFTNEERNAVKKALKLRGVDMRAAEMEKEYNHRASKWMFSNEGTMLFGDCLRVDYEVDEKTKAITFGKSSSHVNPGNREMNAVLLEMDKATLSTQITRDNDVALTDQALSVFSAAQIARLLNLAIDHKATRCTALLLNYKNEHFPEFAEVNEFSLDW